MLTYYKVVKMAIINILYGVLKYVALVVIPYVSPYYTNIVDHMLTCRESTFYYSATASSFIP